MRKRGIEREERNVIFPEMNAGKILLMMRYSVECDRFSVSLILIGVLLTLKRSYRNHSQIRI